MFGEHGDLPSRLVCDGEREPEEDVRPVREPDEHALVAREVARRKALATLAVPFTEVPVQAGSPSLGDYRGHWYSRGAASVWWTSAGPSETMAVATPASAPDGLG